MMPQNTLSPPERFLAIDVETAAPPRRSICQIGLVEMEGSKEIASHCWFVDPQTPFTLTWLHGISAETVRGAPTFAELAPDLRQRMQGRLVVSHSAFDMQAINAASDHARSEPINCTWIDSMDMIGQIRFDRSPESFSLADICDALGISLDHHHALSDARAAARIAATALEHSGRALVEWHDQTA